MKTDTDLPARVRKGLNVGIWVLVGIGVMAVVVSVCRQDVGPGLVAISIGLVDGVLLGFAQSRASLRAMRQLDVDSQVSRPKAALSGKRVRADHESDQLLVDLAEYKEVRVTRNLASESAARLFQYFQFALVAAIGLALLAANTSVSSGGAPSGSGSSGFLGLGALSPEGVSALLLGAALILSALAADILHWHHDVMTLEDYQERVLRPRLSQVVGRGVLGAEEHITVVRSSINWTWGALADLTKRSWIDPFVLKEFGHVFILGLAGVGSATYAFIRVDYSNAILVLASFAIGIYALAVWASFWSVSFQYLAWKRHVLPAGRMHEALEGNE